MIVLRLMILFGVLTSIVADASAAEWVNISDELCRKLGAMEFYGKDGKPWNWHRRTQGMAVDPTTGRVFLHIAAHEAGTFVSGDHGDTWNKLGDNKNTGRGVSLFSFSQSYPFTGRMAFFTIDGEGGMTLDDGRHWTRIAKHRRSFDFGDVDWSSPEPKTMFALNHEPFGRCVSTDAGTTWTQLDNYTGSNEANQIGRGFRLGVFDAQTLLSAHLDVDGIELSTNLGKTWTKVADYRVIGHRPVHYGKRLNWATTEGIIVTDDGRNWTLVGASLPNASYGPCFGKSENEMMVVTPEGFFITNDAAKKWRKAAEYFVTPDNPARQGYHINAAGQHFAWDSLNNLLYAATTGGGAFRLHLEE